MLTRYSMRIDLAWAAGLFEGEGSVGRYSSTTAAIAMTDRDVLVRFAAAVGIGRVYGPYIKKKKSRKPVWLWRVSSYDTVAQLFQMLESWLGPRRREQFARALAGPPRSRRGPRPLPPSTTPFCGRGTNYGYERHLRHGEPPCRECRAAKRAYRRDLKRKTHASHPSA